MTMRTSLSRLAVAAAASFMCCATQASWLWDVGGATPTRVELATAAVQASPEPGPVDAILPLDDGGAWLRRRDEVTRLAPDLGVAARATIAGAGAMHWEPDARQLWVAAGEDLLRYDDTLELLGVTRLGAAIRGLAGSGPEAIWVATDTRLSRVGSDGAIAGAFDLLALRGNDTVRGVLADTPRARVWVVGGTGALLPIDVADGLRLGGPRLALARDARVVAVDAAGGALRQLVDHGWRPVGVDADFAAAAGAHAAAAPQTIGVVRFANRDVPAEPSLAIAAPVVVVGDTVGRRWHWLPPVAFTVSVRAPEEPHSPAATTIFMALEAACGGAPCSNAEPWLASLRGEIALAGRTAPAVVDRIDERWIVRAEPTGPIAPGTHPLVVMLVDAFGNGFRFDDHAVVVDAAGTAQARRATPKATPVVSITGPANGATFVAPASIAIGATASVSGATLTKVEFHRDGVLLATDTTAPYAYTWTNVAAGTYSLTAKAYDNAGGAATSAPVGITVKANAAPTVSLTAPAANTVFTAPATINLAATAGDTDGTIAKVEFFNGSTRLATDTLAPYSHAWTNVAGGTYTLTAKATDDKGTVTTSAAVTAIVNRPPATSITAPANNATLVAPVNVTVTASASDPDGTVAKVEFFRNGTLAATDTTSPYNFAWNNVPLGTHALTSRATDNRGATTTSAPVTFTVAANAAPSVTITSPQPGARFVHPAAVPIAATATDGDGTISRVEFHYDYGLLGTDTSSPYAYTWNSPYTGTFALTARAVDNKGAVTASAPVSITIDVNQPPSVVLTGDPPAGELATSVPPTFQLTATVSDVDGAVTSVRFLRYDPLVEEYVEIATVAQPPFATQFAAPSLESEYRFRAEATDNGGAVGTAEIDYMVVSNRPPQPARVEPGAEAEWSGFIAPATIVVVAETKELDAAPDRVARVDLLANGTLVASLTAPAGARGEYVHVWRNVAVGTYNVVVRVIDTFGAASESTRTIRVVDTSAVASIAIAQPVSGQVYGDPVPLQASVVAAASPVSHVDYVNARGRKVASSSTAPYSASWAAPSAGRQAITAVAVQADGVAVTSPTVFFDVAAAAKGPPLVVLTAPAAQSTLNADAPVVIAADALADRGASIGKVEFFRNGVLIGTATSAPYQISWSGAPAGAATLTAKATDSTAPAAGSSATSSPIVVTLASSNPPPSVSLSAPAAGTTYAAPATITLSATASDSNGSVAKVEFFAGTTLLGIDTTAPYTFTWSNVPAGSYTLTARATDNGGAAATSAARTIGVVANAPPQVALTAPAAGQAYAYGAPIPLAATASDADGAIAKVEFFAGATRLTTDTSSPYSFTWTNAAVGTHSITARATDNLGVEATTAAVSVVVTANALPTVTLGLPRAGQRFVTGQTILLVATAADSDGSLARVEFLRDGVIVAIATAPPYTHAWTNAATGSYTIQARAIDNQGAVRVSPGASVSVAPLAITVISPAENAQIAAASVLVTGTFSAPANSGVVVNGVRARVDGNRFFANDVPLAEGPNSLSVAVVAADGSAMSVSRNVTRTGSVPIRVWVEQESGYVPHTTTVRAANTGGPGIASVAYENLDGATVDTTGANQETLGRLALPFATMVTPTVVVTDTAGNVYRRQVGLIAESKLLVDAQLKESWNTYATVLAAGRVDLALASLPPVTAARYKPILEPLAPHFATIVPTWSAPMTGRLADDVGEYTIGRAIDGQNRLFFIYFVRDDRGIWRLDSM